MAHISKPNETSKLISHRNTGEIKSFDYFSGFGFVAHRINEIYMHWTSIMIENGSTLSMCIFRGKFVEFDVIQTATGIQAVNVTDIGGAPFKDNLRNCSENMPLCINQSFYFKLNANIDNYALKNEINFADRPRYAQLFLKRPFDDKNNQFKERANIGEFTRSLPKTDNSRAECSDNNCENIRRDSLNDSIEKSYRFKVNENVEEKPSNDRNYQEEIINEQLCAKQEYYDNKSLYHRWLTGYHSLCKIQNMHSALECSSANVDHAVDFLELDKLFKTHSVQKVCYSFKKWTE